MSAKPTPGPWFLESHGEFGYEIRSDCATSSMTVAKIPWTSGADEANARLISAAPDYDAAAKLALRFLSSLNGRVSEQVWRDAFDTMKALSDAIAKAKGDS